MWEEITEQEFKKISSTGDYRKWHYIYSKGNDMTIFRDETTKLKLKTEYKKIGNEYVKEWYKEVV